MSDVTAGVGTATLNKFFQGLGELLPGDRLRCKSAMEPQLNTGSDVWVEVCGVVATPCHCKTPSDIALRCHSITRRHTGHIGVPTTAARMGAGRRCDASDTFNKKGLGIGKYQRRGTRDLRR